MTQELSLAVVPGQVVAPACEGTPGPGTYLHEGEVRASLLGVGAKDSKGILSVTSHRDKRTVVPLIGDIVIGKVTLVNFRQAQIDIEVINGKPVREVYPGLIRLQDIRDYDRAKCQISTSFRPGDIVKAKILSMGDERSHFLTTIDDDLGVILAKSRITSEPLIPISATEMKCPITEKVELRKVAKILEDRFAAM